VSKDKSRVYGTVAEVEALITAANTIEGYPNATTKTDTIAVPVVAEDGQAEIPDKLPPKCSHLATKLKRRPRVDKEPTNIDMTPGVLFMPEVVEPKPVVPTNVWGNPI